MHETVPSVPENTISKPAQSHPAGTPKIAPEADTVALARAITAVNELPLAPEVKADIIRRLAGQ